MSDPGFDWFVERVPLVTRFGFELRERAAEHVVLSAPVGPEMLQIEGVVHGGLLATLADTAAVVLLHGGLPPGRTLTSIEFKLNFVRPALAAAGPLSARATAVKRGRTVSLCDVEVRQADGLVAKGLFTYLIYDRGSGAG